MLLNFSLTYARHETEHSCLAISVLQRKSSSVNRTKIMHSAFLGHSTSQNASPHCHVRNLNRPGRLWRLPRKKRWAVSAVVLAIVLMVFCPTMNERLTTWANGDLFPEMLHL